MGFFATLKNIANGNRDESRKKATEEAVQESEAIKKPSSIRDLWSKVDHVAIVVSNLETSIDFYTNIIGFKQIGLPNLDGNSVCLSCGTLKIFLVQGEGPKFGEDGTVFPHLALSVQDLDAMKDRCAELGILVEEIDLTRNPNCEEGSSIRGLQIRDPDGNLIVLGDAAGLEAFNDEGQDGSLEVIIIKAFHSVKAKAHLLEQVVKGSQESDGLEVISEDKEKELLEEQSVENWSEVEVNMDQLKRLQVRHEFYGDLVQNAKRDELLELLKRFDNHVDQVLDYLRGRRQRKGTQTFIPPEFTDEKGQKHTLPSFEMPFFIQEEDQIHTNGDVTAPE
ncbi:hypothetical protein TCAL_10540 [Tigriopus californicus]|uniref:Glyoxalase domain-containing protein 5 n=1 Tax=Tigriopus californicus TaxID=6832 RepID=A0A553PHN6_TIGCA|nr:uncharacterized protein LOC131881044 [Tigriopus californicus]TRY77193.1 hypothetical protein TCAL_10540 [Tigriopus californicus]|eukprot:TCALIF_10540-PA protein Name:"Protein of unknown function" AED:0.00 eAED:0.00 QI:69/1/1/1/1/1/4/244/335